MWYEYACWRYRQRASRHMLKHSNLDGGARERHQQIHVKYSYPDTEVRKGDFRTDACIEGMQIHVKHMQTGAKERP